jgi:asparagine synthase (glutamine-hydrolysing)
MCGICGFYHKKKLREKDLYNMNQTISYRGPDDEGYYLYNANNDYQIGLAQKRLSIIDLSPLGHQPMMSQDENIIIIFNGEVYNFLEIRNGLVADGFNFKSNTDTEVIIHAYEKWGINCVQYFNGMFAMALFDVKKNELYLIRDRVGVKPLYYYYNNGDLVFSSELKPIMKYPYFSKNINQDALNMYLHHQYITAPYTIFDNVYKLNPGTYLHYKNGEIKEIEYWSMRNKYTNINTISTKNEKEYIKELECLLIDSVSLRMISDVPVGAFLSGGVDSSLIVALMQKISNRPVKTFTIGFKEEKYNEAKSSKKVAEYLGTEHHEVYFSVIKAKEFIESIPTYYDEPFADSSQLATMLVSKVAKQYVTVTLSGDGGDELFCGYSKYENIIRLQKYSGISRILNTLDGFLTIKNMLLNYIDNRDIHKLLNLNCPDNIINSDYLTFKDRYNNLLLSPYNTNIKYFDILKATNNIQVKHMLLDMITYLPDDILTKVDRASMAVSLEARTPLLDYRIVEYALKLPHELKYKNRIKKYILKELLFKYIPKELIDKPKKGFGVPVDQWISEDFKGYSKNYFDFNFIRRQEIFNHEVINEIVSSFKSKKNPNTARLIWTLIVFQMWYEEYMI